MRLSHWRAAAPHAGSMSDRVLAAVEPVLAGLGCEPDPPCWVAWGDDPGLRYVILALSDAGIATCHVRVSVPQEGPRASGKLARWNRVQVGELTVETQGGHTMVSFQLEGQLIRGVDDDAGAVTEFALDVIAGADGRPLPSLSSGRSSGREAPIVAGPPRARASGSRGNPPERSESTGDALPALPPPRAVT